MSVEYRKNRKLGLSVLPRGQCFSRYVWETKTEAKQAEREAQVEAKRTPDYSQRRY